MEGFGGPSDGAAAAKAAGSAGAAAAGAGARVGAEDSFSVSVARMGEGTSELPKS